MKYIFSLSIISTLLYGNCNYTDAVKKETQTRIANHKAFMNTFSFEGVCSRKYNCEKCTDYKYHVVLDIKNYFPAEITLTNQIFPPYYTLDTAGRTLTIAVTKNIFATIERGVVISKKQHSNNLLIAGISEPWISVEQFKILDY